MKIEIKDGSDIEMVGIEDDDPLIIVVSHNTKKWQEIGTISEDTKELAVRQYQFGHRNYPMLGIEHNLGIGKNSIITDDLPKTAEAISLIFFIIRNLEEFKKIILVIHDNELFNGEAGQYPTTNKQKREEKGTVTLYDCSALDPNGEMNDKIQYLICTAFKERKINSNCEFELWSFRHSDCDIDNKALNLTEGSGYNVYDELIKVLIPNFKKKLVDIKFCTLQLLLPLHIDFIGLSACDETKRNEYWDKIKKVYFNDDQYKETLNEVCTLINGNGSDNVESISSFVADAGFENNKHWVGLKSLIGKDSNADDFFKSFSKDNLSELVNAIENFKFSSGENGHMREITGWAAWYASIIEHFDALIAAV
jgi:hypothetical protein